MFFNGLVIQDNLLGFRRYICAKAGGIPSFCFIRGDLRIVETQPFSGGGFADVWKGEYNDRKVAIKAIRLYPKDDLSKVQKRFCKEVITWIYLSHPNVVPFLGVSTNIAMPSKFCMVSDWMENGTIVEYLQCAPSSDRGKFVVGIILGLKYLHSNGVVHGDLKGSNILVNDKLQACLVDFGLATAAHNIQDLTRSTTSEDGSCSWMAPELFAPEIFGFERPERTKQTDIYSFAIVVLEIFAGTIPWPEKTRYQVMSLVVGGVRPSRGVDLVPDGLRDVMEDCWRQLPKERPEVSQIAASIINMD